jgi:pimeloyl-ACP methyl ester carboxylesterase
MPRICLSVLAFAALLFPAALSAETPFASDRISVTVEGEGPDVVLVPGLTSSPAVWTDATAAVPGYRYHFVQVKGFAGTPPEGNAEGKVVASAAEEIARYIVDAKLEKPAVIGHSMGGTITLMIGARHPEAVSKLMVVDQLPFMGAVFGPPGTTAESLRPVADKFHADMMGRPAAEHEQRIGAMIGAMVATEAKRAGAVKSALDSDRGVTASAFRELIVTDLRPELPRIAVPTTVLYVTPAGPQFNDAMIDAAYKADYAGLKGVKLVRIPSSAHFIMYDNPERFTAEMKAFLAER